VWARRMIHFALAEASVHKVVKGFVQLNKTPYK